MIKIRSNTFETNSSSTHSIVIDKSEVNLKKLKNRQVYFGLGEYGWEDNCVADTASYLYTAIAGIYDDNEIEEKLNIIKTTLDKYNISYMFAKIDGKNTLYNSFYIDHVGCCKPFVEAILTNEDLLLKYLFGKNSCIYTGNDNSSDENSMCNCAEPKIYSEDWKLIDNPNHDESKFIYFYKEN